MLVLIYKKMINNKIEKGERGKKYWCHARIEFMLKKITILSLILASLSLYAEGKYEGKLEKTVVTATGFSDNVDNQRKNVTMIT